MKGSVAVQFDESCGRYYARLQVDGVRKRFWLGPSKKQAKVNLKGILKDIAAGKIAFATAETTATTTPSGGKDMRLEELVHKYLSWVEENLSPRTYLTRRYTINEFVKYVGASMVSQITRLQLMEFHSWVRKHRGHGANAGNHHLRDVRTMLRWAEENDVCDNPVHRFPMIHHTPPPTRRFTDEEVVKLLQRIPDGTFRDMTLFGLFTGLRPQEIRELTCANVVHNSEGRFHLVIEQHKTAKMTSDPVPRTVPLTNEAVQIVQRQVGLHPKAEHVFLTEDGTPYSAGVFRHSMERWCRRAGVAKHTPYGLRHTFASRQADADTNIVSLAQLMGHSSTRTTARYISSTAKHHREVVERNANGILALVGEIGAKVETGKKVASKVASNSEQQKQEGGRDAANP